MHFDPKERGLRMSAATVEHPDSRGLGLWSEAQCHAASAQARIESPNAYTGPVIFLPNRYETGQPRQAMSSLVQQRMIELAPAGFYTSDDFLTTRTAINTRQETAETIRYSLIYGATQVDAVTVEYHAPRAERNLREAAKDTNIQISVTTTESLLKFAADYDPARFGNFNEFLALYGKSALRDSLIMREKGTNRLDSDPKMRQLLAFLEDIHLLRALNAMALKIADARNPRRIQIRRETEELFALLNAA